MACSFNLNDACPVWRKTYLCYQSTISVWAFQTNTFSKTSTLNLPRIATGSSAQPMLANQLFSKSFPERLSRPQAMSVLCRENVLRPFCRTIFARCVFIVRDTVIMGTKTIRHHAGKRCASTARKILAMRTEFCPELEHEFSEMKMVGTRNKCRKTSYGSWH